MKKPPSESQPSQGRSAQSADDWVKFYFVKPQPERFVQEVRHFSSAGALAQASSALPIIAFLSRIMAANADQVSAWLEALQDLPDADFHSLQLAVWLSGAAQVPSRPGATLDPIFTETAPDLLQRQINDPIMLDVLWTIYFATGDLRAVRRIISVLEYMSDLGAAKSYSETTRTDGDKARAMRDALFQAASWSLGSLMREYSPLQDFCGTLVRSGDLTPNERCALAIVLSQVAPDTWRVDIDPVTSKVTISSANAAPARTEAKPRWKPW